VNDRGIYSRSALSAAAFFALLACATLGRAQCLVSATTLDFGTYVPLGATTGLGTIEVGCLSLVKIDAGGAGSFTPRSMKSPINVALDYNLYVDGAFVQIWGDGTSGTVTNSGPGILTVYGKIPAGQGVDPGVYSDTVIITVEF